jgi:hypothetical protein
MKNLEMRQQSAMESAQCCREGENMRPLKKYQLLVMAGLLLCTSVAWGKEFSDTITGQAISCVTKSYNESGNTKDGYKINDKAVAPKCTNFGSAKVMSGAQIGPPVINGSATTTTPKLLSSGLAGAISNDTAYLTPPAGFKGDTVQVILKSAYQFSIQGVGGKSTGVYVIEWLINNGQFAHVVQSAKNGHHTSNLRFSFDVQKSESDGDFTFLLSVGGTAQVANGASASFKVLNLTLALPQGLDI